MAVGSPGLAGPSTPRSSLKGWAGRVPAFPPAPHTKLPWGRQAFNPPSSEEGKGGTGMLAVLGGSAIPRGGEGKTSVFMRCRSCVCSPRWVRLSGTGLLGKSDPRASDASAQLQLGAPRAVPAAVPSAPRSGPPGAGTGAAGWAGARLACPPGTERQQRLWAVRTQTQPRALREGILAPLEVRETASNTCGRFGGSRCRKQS